MKSYETHVDVPATTCADADSAPEPLLSARSWLLHSFYRPCAQAPLADLAADGEVATLGCGGLAARLADARRAWAAAGGEASLGSADLRCVLPLADGRTWPWQARLRVQAFPKRNVMYAVQLCLDTVRSTAASGQRGPALRAAAQGQAHLALAGAVSF